MNDVLLSATGLHKTYLLGQRSLEVLRGVDLQLQRGEFLALRGASGAPVHCQGLLRSLLGRGSRRVPPAPRRPAAHECVAFDKETPGAYY